MQPSQAFRGRSERRSLMDGSLFRRTFSFSEDGAIGRLRQRVTMDEDMCGMQLVAAAKRGDIHKLKSLLKNKKSDIEYADLEGRTAMHHASKNGHLSVVEHLSSAGGKINAQDYSGKTALYEALANDDIELVNFLKKHGAVDSEKFAEKERTFDGGSMETGDVVSHSVVKKLCVLSSVPFVLLVAMQGSWFLFMFAILTAVWFVFIAAYLVSELSVRPPWYQPAPGKPLTQQGLPEYWQGIYTNPKYDHDLTYEDVEFKSGRYTIRGWWIQGTTDKCLIFVHGGGRDRRAWLRHLKTLRNDGEYSALLFDLREHGASDGSGIGFHYGITESRDVESAAAWAKANRGMSMVVVIGTSVGGSAVIIAAAHSDNIDLVVSENPVTHATALQQFHLENNVNTYIGSSFSLRLFAAVFGAVASAMLKARIGITSKEAIHVVSGLRQPILLMHGRGDKVVPHCHSEELFALASEPKELWMAPDAFHCGLFDRYPQEFNSRVSSFLKKHL